MKKIILFDIDNTLFNTPLFKSSNLTTYKTYDEVKQVLEELKTLALLGIFSQGDESFQGQKLKESLIDTFFLQEHIHIFVEKISQLPDVLGKYKANALFLVDDKLDVLHKAKEHMHSIFTVWVKRGEYAESQKPINGFSPDAMIVDLKELKSIVKENK